MSIPIWGMAIALTMPMMATTINVSIRVKAFLLRRIRVLGGLMQGVLIFSIFVNWFLILYSLIICIDLMRSKMKAKAYK